MRLFPVSCVVIALIPVALCGITDLFTARSVAFAETVAKKPATPKVRRAVSYEITNNGRLVTVRKADGTNVWAQVINTPDLHVDLYAVNAERKMTITLRDANRKRLWEITLGDGGYGQVGFGWKASNKKGNIGTFSFTPTDDAPSKEIRPEKIATGRFVISKNNTLIFGEMRSDNVPIYRMVQKGDELVAYDIVNGKPVENYRMSRNGDVTTMRISKDGKPAGSVSMGDKSVTATDKNGKQIVSATTDKNVVTIQTPNGTETIRTTTRNGKSYLEFDNGGRKFLIEIGSFEIESGDNGEMIFNKAKP